jgi:hypothetical protein
MSYPIGIDRELSVGDRVYYVGLDAEIDYTNEEDPEPCEVQITKAEIAPLEGENLPLAYEGNSIEKVVVEGHPELTEAIDQALWDEIRTYTEDNYGDLIRDLRDAEDDHWL